MSKWVKTSPYGDYKETKDRKSRRTSKVTHIIREAKALGVCGKHAGSKAINKLLNGISKAHEAMKPVKEEIEESKDKEE